MHNESVAEVAISVWDNVVTVVKYYTSLVPSNRPQNNKSYTTLSGSVNDILMKMKFLFFKELASLLNTFLVTFQTDKPMLPSLSETLFKLIKRILKMFVLGKTVGKFGCEKQGHLSSSSSYEVANICYEYD